jgi:hypothetical protein
MKEIFRAELEKSKFFLHSTQGLDYSVSTVFIVKNYRVWRREAPNRACGSETDEGMSPFDTPGAKILISPSSGVFFVQGKLVILLKKIIWCY